MSEGGRVLQLLGTFLPLYGVALTVGLGVFLKGRSRAAALLFVPLLTYLLCSYFGAAIAFDGNMLYVVQVAIFLTVLPFYYPALLVFYGVIWLRAHRGEHS